MAKKERKSYTESDKLTDKQKLGNLGEDIAERFLMKHDFEILERNYWKKWGEIDIVAQKNGVLHFVEVKSVSREILPDVAHETSDEGNDSYRAEDNIHPQKLKRLARVIQTYLLEENHDGDWHLDVAIVYINEKENIARVNYLKDIII